MIVYKIDDVIFCSDRDGAHSVLPVFALLRWSGLDGAAAAVVSAPICLPAGRGWLQ